MNDGEVSNLIVKYHLFESTLNSFFNFMGVIFFQLFVKCRVIMLSVTFFLVIFGIKYDYSFSYISWFYNNV